MRRVWPTILPLLVACGQASAPVVASGGGGERPRAATPRGRCPGAEPLYSAASPSADVPLGERLELPALPTADECDDACAAALVREYGLDPEAVARWRRAGGDLGWYAAVVRVWPAADDRCARAAVLVEVEWQSEEDGETLGSRYLTVEVDGAGRLVTGRELSPTDPLVVARPDVGDLDGDGVPDRLDEVDAVAAACPGGRSEPGPCTTCGIVSGRTVEVRGSAGGLLAGPVPRVGRAADAVTERAIADGLAARGCRRDRDDEAPACCFELDASWRLLLDVGQPVVRRDAHGIAVDHVVRRLECRGWCPDGLGASCLAPDGAGPAPCTDQGPFLESHVYGAAGHRVIERALPAGGAVARVAAPWCGASCRLAARETIDPDTDRRPHRVVREPYDNAEGRDGVGEVGLPVGFWLVTATPAGGEARVYQVTVTAETDRIVLP